MQGSLNYSNPAHCVKKPDVRAEKINSKFPVAPNSSNPGARRSSLLRLHSRERPLHDSFVLLDGDDLVGFYFCQFGDCAAWPDNFEGIHLRVAANTKMQPWILRRLVAHAPFLLIVLD